VGLSRIRATAGAGNRDGILQVCRDELLIGDLVGDSPSRSCRGDLRICNPAHPRTVRWSHAYEQFGARLRQANPVLIDDGKIHLEVTDIDLDTDTATSSACRRAGRDILPRKGINLPTRVSSPALTQKIATTRVRACARGRLVAPASS